MDSADGVVVETGLSGSDAVVSFKTSYRLLAGIEVPYIGKANGARAFGNAGDNKIVDGAGNDSIVGLGGNVAQKRHACRRIRARSL